MSGGSSTDPSAVDPSAAFQQMADAVANLKGTDLPPDLQAQLDQIMQLLQQLGVIPAQQGSDGTQASSGSNGSQGNGYSARDSFEDGKRAHHHRHHHHVVPVQQKDPSVATSNGSGKDPTTNNI